MKLRILPTAVNQDIHGKAYTDYLQLSDSSQAVRGPSWHRPASLRLVKVARFGESIIADIAVIGYLRSHSRERKGREHSYC
jgi:hypothetical protein